MQRTCANSWCKASFEITDDDLVFIETVSPVFAEKKFPIPPPSFCPDCRMQQRMMWRNERFIHRSACSRCKKQMISQYPSESPYTVYCQECFWGDDWSALSFGQTFDFGRSFMDQFGELLTSTPLLALINTQTENSEYCHRIYDGRNNYLSFIALFEPENLLHTFYTMSCKDSADITITQYSELCYETTDAERCYHCLYSQRIRNCRDCFFIEDCIGCSNCIGCKNLHQKQYCIFNEQKSPEEFSAFLQGCAFGSAKFIAEMQEKARKFFLTLPNRPVVIVNEENVTGAFIFNSRNCTEVYDVFECEELKNVGQAERSHHCQDCYGMGNASFCYQGVTLGISPSHHILFSAEVLSGCSEMLYCYDCYAGCQNCFGCIGLKKASYCIFNRQYTKEEYEKLSAKIIEHMKESAEWGKTFPAEICPVPYNESVAQEYFPLKKEVSLQRGWQWRDLVDEMPTVTKVIPAEKLPDAIADIPDDILEWAIECAVTKRPFRIIKQELEFLRRMTIPIPRLHPDERHWRNSSS